MRVPHLFPANTLSHTHTHTHTRTHTYLITGTRQRRRFYAEFVGMPLFEDMAPWNLVFVAGQLAYIDQDTQVETLNAKPQDRKR